MESVTKNRQEPLMLREMVKRAFGSDVCPEISELGEGYFNAAYHVRLSKDRDVILKIAPRRDVKVMSYEKNIMDSEVRCMRLVRERTDLPVAEVLYFDDTCRLCGSPYFFMEKLPGRSLQELKPDLPKAEWSRLQRRTGQMNRRLHEITGNSFGYPGQPEQQRASWYEAFRRMLEMAVEDARAVEDKQAVEDARTVEELQPAGVIGIPAEELWACLERSRSLFGQVTVPRLIHWDLWAGNILTENGEITGLIDWERCIWGDPLMEVGFRTYQYDPDFYRGYGREALSGAERLRVLWYDVYLLYLAAMEADYRQYENREMQAWAKRRLRRSMEELKSGLADYLR